MKEFTGFIGARGGLVLGMLGAVYGRIIGVERIYEIKEEISKIYNKALEEVYTNIVDECINELKENDNSGFFCKSACSYRRRNIFV